MRRIGDFETEYNLLYKLNIPLYKLISDMNITEDEYTLLSTIVSSNYMYKKNAHGAQVWLGPILDIGSIPTTTKQVFILQVPYDKLPMYINDECLEYRWIAQWRLKIGR